MFHSENIKTMIVYYKILQKLAHQKTLAKSKKKQANYRHYSIFNTFYYNLDIGLLNSMSLQTYV